MTVHVQPVVRPEACPALVLNADYRPLSYYPLSIWCWQDAINAVLAAVGYNFRLLLRWLAVLWTLIRALLAPVPDCSSPHQTV